MSSPLEEFMNNHEERWKVLQDIPDWEWSRILLWFYNVYNYEVQNYPYDMKMEFNSSALTDIETANHLLLGRDLGIDASSWIGLRSSLQGLFGVDNLKIVFFLELSVKMVRDGQHNSYLFGKNLTSVDAVLDMLEALLENGSKWTVVREKYARAGLVERVDPGVVTIARSIQDKHLDQAWSLAFGIKPDPEKAIEKAQSAVEDIATSVGLSKDTTSVYGKLIGDIRTHKSKSYVSVAKPAFDLANSLKGISSGQDSYNDLFTDWLWLTLDLVQNTNPGRHPNIVTKGFTLPPEAGKQAVLMATMICYFLKEGFITRPAKQPKKSDSSSPSV